MNYSDHIKRLLSLLIHFDDENGIGDDLKSGELPLGTSHHGDEVSGMFDRLAEERDRVGTRLRQNPILVLGSFLIFFGFLDNL
jgi:hypothetical protein